MRTRTCLLVIALLMLPLCASAQTVVDKGPVTTAMKVAWELPTNVPLTDAATFEYRLRDTVTGATVTVLTASCAAGTPAICTAPISQALADQLNRVGNHGLTLTLFRADVGESPASLPFGLLSPAGAPSGTRIIR